MANKKISQLPVVTNSAVGGASIVPLVDSVDSTTKTMSLSQFDIRYIPAMPTTTILGNITGGTASPVSLTPTQVTSMLNVLVGDSGSGGTKGLVPAPAAGDAAAGKFLKASGAYAVPAVVLPSGIILPFGGTSAPTGYQLCNGALISRTTFASLFAAIGTAYGSGDGSTTFALPDLRYSTLRGVGTNTSATGSGTVATNNATFTAHGFTRTGLQVRMSSGTLTGLALLTDYWIIVVDANTLAFSTTRANALAGTKITISGTNAAVVTQYMDPDVATRPALQSGGNTGANVGSYQDDSVQGHFHLLYSGPNTSLGSQVFAFSAGSSVGLSGVGDGSTPTHGKTIDEDKVSGFGLPKVSGESRAKNVYVNYIITN